jgi:hypothetical protein
LIIRDSLGSFNSVEYRSVKSLVSRRGTDFIRLRLRLRRPSVFTGHARSMLLPKQQTSLAHTSYTTTQQRGPTPKNKARNEKSQTWAATSSGQGQRSTTCKTKRGGAQVWTCTCACAWGGSLPEGMRLGQARIPHTSWCWPSACRRLPNQAPMTGCRASCVA